MLCRVKATLLKVTIVTFTGSTIGVVDGAPFGSGILATLAMRMREGLATLKFSIVTPVFNGMPWLPECVESVAAQRSDADVEHLIYDGGSTDGSREWLREHTGMGYVAIFEPDAGQTDALIKGFSLASGDVFGWVNADDLLQPGALRCVASTFEADADAILVGGCCLLIDAAGGFRGLIGTPPSCDFRGLLTHIDNPPNPQPSSAQSPTVPWAVSTPSTTSRWTLISGSNWRSLGRWCFYHGQFWPGSASTTTRSL